jgi:hypothetical protein
MHCKYKRGNIYTVVDLFCEKPKTLKLISAASQLNTQHPLRTGWLLVRSLSGETYSSEISLCKSTLLVGLVHNRHHYHLVNE